MINTLTPGSEGSTFGGYPLGAVVGVYAIKVLVEEKLSENAKMRGAQLMGHFENIQSDFHFFARDPGSTDDQTPGNGPCFRGVGHCFLGTSRGGTCYELLRWA